MTRADDRRGVEASNSTCFSYRLRLSPCLQDTCPEFLGSFSAYITYDWFTPTVVLGYKKSLEQSDLWKLGPRDISSGHLPAFEADWKAAVADWRHR